jgi:hypothetical protein
MALDLCFSWVVEVAVGWVWVWGVWTGPGLVWMGCGDDPVAMLWEGLLRKILFHNGNLTSALAGWWRRLWAGSGCGGSGRAPGWCGWAVASLLRRCCGGAVCWRPVISLLAQSVIVGEEG